MILAIQGIVGSRTFDLSAVKKKAILKESGIQNETSASVTDSSSNFIQAFRLFQEQDNILGDVDGPEDSFSHLPAEACEVCYSHAQHDGNKRCKRATHE